MILPWLWVAIISNMEQRLNEHHLTYTPLDSLICIDIK